LSVDINTDFIEFFIKNIPSKYDYKPIYHYTSPNGFLDIIKENKLWFTRYDCLNDYTEREYIFDVFKSVCEKLVETKQISKKLYDDIIDLEIDKKEFLPYYDDSLYYGEFESEYYICCFSRDRDSLPMWNYYSKDNRYEGYNLEFSSDIIDYLRNKNRKCSMKVFDVIYDKQEQEKRIGGAILKLEDIIDKNNKKSFKRELAEFIKTYAFVFKNPCFQHEKETRIILIIPKEGNSFYPIQYRNSNGCIVPYVEYEFDKDSMTGVTIGPLINAEIAEKTVWRMLKDNGYLSDNIVKSKVPIRF